MTTVSTCLTTAVAIASRKHHDLHKRWIRLSLLIGGKDLVLRQSDGRLDLVLREMELETLARVPKRDQGDETELLAFDMQCALSMYWIASVYEGIRLVTKRNPADKLKALHSRFEMVRVPLAKGQIARDRNMGEITLVKVGPGDPDPQTYSAKSRIHYRPVHLLCLETGSIGWNVMDASKGGETFISRRMLSDEVLNLVD
jgi:hypothetical protein